MVCPNGKFFTDYTYKQLFSSLHTLVNSNNATSHNYWHDKDLYWIRPSHDTYNHALYWWQGVNQCHGFNHANFCYTSPSVCVRYHSIYIFYIFVNIINVDNLICKLKLVYSTAVTCDFETGNTCFLENLEQTLISEKDTVSTELQKDDFDWTLHSVRKS